MNESVAIRFTGRSRSGVRHAKAGFTLLEIVVVLLILTLLAQSAVLSLEGVASEERRSVTIDALSAAEDAILGRKGVIGPDDRPWVEGFVADMGRLPRARGVDPKNLASELWTQGTLPAFQLSSAPGDSEVRLLTGWRGPYLKLGVGQSTWFDGFGNDWEYLDPSGTPITDSAKIGSITSRGADGILGGPTPDEEFTITFDESAAGNVVGIVPFSVIPKDLPGTSIVVRIYGARNGNLRTLEEKIAPVSGVLPIVDAFAQVPIGHRALRVYQTTAPPTDPELPIAGATVSEVIPLIVVPGGIPTVTVDMGDP